VPVTQRAGGGLIVGPSLSKTFQGVDMEPVQELKTKLKLRLQAIAIEHQRIAKILRDEAAKHEAEAERLIQDSSSEAYK